MLLGGVNIVLGSFIDALIFRWLICLDAYERRCSVDTIRYDSIRCNFMSSTSTFHSSFLPHLFRNPPTCLSLLLQLTIIAYIGRPTSWPMFTHSIAEAVQGHRIRAGCGLVVEMVLIFARLCFVTSLPKLSILQNTFAFVYFFAHTIIQLSHSLPEYSLRTHENSLFLSIFNPGYPPLNTKILVSTMDSRN